VAAVLLLAITAAATIQQCRRTIYVDTDHVTSPRGLRGWRRVPTAQVAKAELVVAGDFRTKSLDLGARKWRGLVLWLANGTGVTLVRYGNARGSLSGGTGADLGEDALVNDLHEVASAIRAAQGPGGIYGSQVIEQTSSLSPFGSTVFATVNAQEPRAPSAGDIAREGWSPDPLGRHELRWMSDGNPTGLVRDGDRELHDPSGL